MSTAGSSPRGVHARRTKHSRPAALALSVLAAACLLAWGTAGPHVGTRASGTNGFVQTLSGTGGRNDASTLDKPYVILVGFDGFGHDYVDRFETPNFDRIAAVGAKADALIPVFPSLTFPSFYSIATGMYPEHHGIVGNRVYDPDLDETYSYQEPETARDGRWYGGQPIWVTAETQGMVAAAYFLPGTEADIQGVRPTFWTPYDSSVPNQARVDQVLAWLELSPRERPHMITLYFSTVDSTGHAFGPGSLQVRSAVEMVDRMLGRLLSGIRRLTYGDRVCLVLVSDHGMTTPRRDSYYAIIDTVDLRGVRSVKTGPNLSLFVPAGRGRAERLRDELNVVLPHGRAYLREELPVHLHARANRRIGDLVIVADEGYDIGVRPRASESLNGAHGWDPTVPSMHGIFLTMGPGIEAGQRIPAFESIHVYPFLAAVLELRPNAEIDGNASVLASLVRSVPGR